MHGALFEVYTENLYRLEILASVELQKHLRSQVEFAHNICQCRFYVDHSYVFCLDSVHFFFCVALKIVFNERAMIGVKS